MQTAALVIWSAVASESLSVVSAMLLTIVVEAVIVAVFIMLVRACMPRLPPQSTR